MTLTIYVEGGGSPKGAPECRKALRQFIERSGVAGGTFRVVASGSRGDARRDFEKELTQSGRAMLLVDSEGPVTVGSPWDHLRAMDNWNRPQSAQDDECHLMVQTMESWFLADKNSLASFYGSGFRVGALPQQADIEAVSKNDVLRTLGAAATDTGKRRYNKGQHAYKILALVDPFAVRSASPWANRFLETVATKTAL